MINALSIHFTKFEKIVTVTDKFVKPGSRSRSTYYHVVDSNGDTYRLTDSLYLFEFNSSDDYARLKIGNRYKIYGYWFRYPIFSWFPMIYKYTIFES